MKRHEIIKMLEEFEMITVNGDVGIPPKQYNALAHEIEKLILTDVGCSLLSKEAIAIEAERRNPYKKHLVDFNNGMHEGFIDGADFVLEAINYTRCCETFTPIEILKVLDDCNSVNDAKQYYLDENI